MLELKNDTLEFSFLHLHENAKVSIDFQRTLRIPDDNKSYALPPGLGRFPIKLVNSVTKEKIPAAWRDHGGVMIPMYQSEALWINFSAHRVRDRLSAYPFAIRIATGKVSAVTGKSFDENLEKDDYLVVPGQPWLDGFVVSDGVIRQFVASPLGSGVSVEQQITGEDKVGGIQIEVIPMKSDIYDKMFPQRVSNTTILRSESSDLYTTKVAASVDYFYSPQFSSDTMSLAAGGKMNQQIFKDVFGLDVWDVEHSSRVFVHLTNSMVWRFVTGTEPPSVPLTAKDYTDRGLPWFEYYSDQASIGASDVMKNIKGINDMPGGKAMLPENESINVENVLNLSWNKEGDS